MIIQLINTHSISNTNIHNAHNTDNIHFNTTNISTVFYQTPGVPLKQRKQSAFMQT